MLPRICVRTAAPPTRRTLAYTHEVQPTSDQKLLYDMSAEALQELTKWLDAGTGLCSQLGYETVTGTKGIDFNKPGGKLVLVPLKALDRAAAKVNNDYGGNWGKINDIVRCAIAVDTQSEVQTMLATLKSHGLKLVYMADRFAAPTLVGYRDMIMKCRFSNGIIGEIQIAVKKMLPAKRLGHVQYEIMQTIERKYHYDGDELKLPLAQWAPADQKAWIAAFDESRAIYGRAWAQIDQQEHAGAQGMAQRMAANTNYDFFEKEGAVFRRPHGHGPVTEVFHEQQKAWVPFKGSGSHVLVHADQISEQDLPGAARHALRH